MRGAIFHIMKAKKRTIVFLFKGGKNADVVISNAHNIDIFVFKKCRTMKDKKNNKKLKKLMIDIQSKESLYITNTREQYAKTKKK